MPEINWSRIYNQMNNDRILILDGAMGTMIQKHSLTEVDYRGDVFCGCGSELRGNNECLNLTRPDIIKSIHREYIDAGADIVWGSHPHVLQPVENWEDGIIFYSLGNFCFGGNKNPGDKDSMIFQQTFELTEDGKLVDNGRISISGKAVLVAISELNLELR